MIDYLPEWSGKMVGHKILADHIEHLAECEKAVQRYLNKGDFETANQIKQAMQTVGIMINNLKVAQYFDMGEVETLENIGDRLKFENYYSGQAKIKHLPYKYCIFVFQMDGNPQFAYLVTEKEENNKTYFQISNAGWLRQGESSLSIPTCFDYFVVPKGNNIAEIRSASTAFGQTFPENYLKEQLDNWTKNVTSNFRHTLINVSLLLLNTKNVESVKVEPPAKLVKKRKKKGKPPLLSYHLLTVTVPRSKRYDTTGSQDTGIKKRVHLCRGHFRYYSKEKPLFGKYSGMVWVQPHVRGSKDQGMVVKDYVVKTGY